MIKLTQTTFGLEGNCWQTCVACLLEIDPKTMPAQAKYDLVTTGPNGEKIYGPSYRVALGAFLRAHHGLGYVEVYTAALVALSVRDPGWHMIVGPTERGTQHVVVARYGEMAWDPHPSRAGLLDHDRNWGLLVPFPASWEKHWSAVACACPTCTVAA